MKEYELIQAFPNENDEMNKVYEHIEKFIGKPNYINIETMPDSIPINLFISLANNKRKYHTIVTSGMSKQPTKVPDDQNVWQYTELMIYLPKSWPVTKEFLEKLDYYWPLGLLRILAKFPHKNETWFCWGDTIPNGEPPIPYTENTGSCCSILLPPIREDEDFFKLKVDEEKTIRFLVVVPIYKEEMEYKIEHGYKLLLDKFDANNISDILNISRANTCK